jgi:hypothetical protein
MAVFRRVVHDRSGWTTQPAAKDWLLIVPENCQLRHNILGEGRIGETIDVHPARADWQPLDYRIFGSLKAVVPSWVSPYH